MGGVRGMETGIVGTNPSVRISHRNDRGGFAKAREQHRGGGDICPWKQSIGD